MVGLRSVGLGSHDGARESILWRVEEKNGGEERTMRRPWEERKGGEKGSLGERGEKEVEKKVED
jgi:hypothetical protein